jgi:hypothetical protein
MIKLLDMNDFDAYIHRLRTENGVKEDVCTVKESGEAFFEEEENDDSLTWLVRHLFEGLDAWRICGDFDKVASSAYIRSVLAFIGSPVEHGKLISENEETEGDW